MTSWKSTLNVLWLSALVLGSWLTVPTLANADSVGEQARSILKRFAKEPTIREVHKAALEYALIRQDRIVSLMTRARHSGWLPDFRFQYRRNIDDDRTTSFPTPTNPILTTQSTDLDNRFDFTVTWSLDQLIFNQNELAIYRELKRLVELRSDVLKEVTKLYYERRRMQVTLIVAPPAGLLARIRKMLRLQELTADLDALTNGFFKRRLKQKR
jgi:hypothetical protein